MTYIPNKQYNEGDDISVTPTGDVTLARDPDGKAAPLQVDVDGNVKVTGTTDGLTDTELRAVPVPVSGPLTDAQLRATTVPVDGSAHTQPVSGPLTDTQLRASAVPVSTASLPLPSGAATETTLAAIKTKTDNLDVLLSTRTKPGDTQLVDGSAHTQPVSGPLTDTQLRASAVPVSATSLPLPSGAATETTLAAIKSKTDNLDVLLSSVSGGQQYNTGDTIHGVSVIVKGTIPMVVDVAAGDGSATPQTSFGSDGGDPQIVTGSGILGWLVTIVTKLKNLNDRFTFPIQVVPTHIGTLGDPFAVAVEEGYDTDNPIQYPLVLKAGTGQKELMVAVEESVLPTGAATEATLDTLLSRFTDDGSGNLNVNVQASTGGGLTDTQLRASPVPVSGPLTDTQLRASAVPVSGPLTDTQLRASAVPVSASALPLPALAATSTKQSDGTQKTQVVDGSGNVQPAGDIAGRAIKVDASATTQPVSGPLTDAQLRASAVPVSAATLPLPSGAATSANQVTEIASLTNLDVLLSTRTKPSDTQLVDGSAHTQPVSGPLTDTQLRASAVPVSAAALPLPALAATSTKQSDGTQKTQVVDGSGNVQPAGDTAGRAIKVDASATTQPISATSLPLPTGAATLAAQTTAQTSLGNIDTGIGTDGAAPPSIAGTGVRGWLRALYDLFVTGINTFATKGTTGTASWTSATTAGGSGVGTTVVVATAGYQVVRLAGSPSTGGITGTLVLEGSMDGGTNYPFPVNTILDGNGNLGQVSVSGGITLANLFAGGLGSTVIGNCAGFTHVRVRLSVAINTGTVSLFIAAVNSSPAQIPGAVYVDNSSSSPAQVAVASGTLTTCTTVTQVTSITNPVNVKGNAGATLDSAITAATAPSNGVVSNVVAQTTAPSLTAGQACAQQSDYQGSQFVKPFRRGQTGWTPLTISNDSTSKTLVAAQAAGIFADLATLVVTVTPAATTPISFTLTLSDGTQSIVLDMDTGSLTTGTPVPIVLPFNPALKAQTAATAWTAQLSVNTVTVHITTEFVLQKAS